ncbi:MAG: NAD(P)H-dependent oxidoreductase [Clostridia bacterium]|nr:NAD(P)H-dependent oxidoreductase [Clostridia bacterium]
MKILVINGSPRGDYSVTLHTSKYLELKFPEHTFDVLNVGIGIKKFERDFSLAEEKINKADLLIFSYPVYTFIAPSQLHRFIELLKASDAEVKGKFVTQISTSKHFYDVTAHNYIRDNCFDMEMKYIKGLSADMDDLTTPKGRADAENFFNYVLWCTENDSYERIPEKADKFVPIKTNTDIDNEINLTDKREIAIVADIGENDDSLKAMIARFQAVLPIKTKLINIREYPFKGGCLGCFNCAVSGKCVYKDNFDEFLRNEIQACSSIVYAFSIKDHSMGAVFKTYDDRQFCNGHRTVTMGMPVGYLISGPYSKEMNLQMIVEGRSEVGGNFLAGVATDEFEPDKQIDRLAKTLVYALDNKYVQPSNFLGVGGMKIFRDLIYLMQGLMRADHKFYKAHGQYDFPQKHKGRLIAMYLVGSLLANEKMKSKMGNKMNEGMAMPYQKVLKDTRKELGIKEEKELVTK